MFWLPTPSEKAVAAFVELAKREYGTEIPPEDARSEATRILHMHFLKEHCAAALRPEIAKELGVDLTAAAAEELAPKKRGWPRKNPEVEFRPMRED